MNETLYY